MTEIEFKERIREIRHAFFLEFPEAASAAADWRLEKLITEAFGGLERLPECHLDVGALAGKIMDALYLCGVTFEDNDHAYGAHVVINSVLSSAMSARSLEEREKEGDE